MKILYEADIIDNIDDIDITKEEAEEIGNELSDFFSNLANSALDTVNENYALNEQFISKFAAQDHFDRHCIGGEQVKREGNYNPYELYYNYYNIKDYLALESRVCRKYANSFKLTSFFEPSQIRKLHIYVDALMTRRTVLILDSSCGIHTNKGPASICFCSNVDHDIYQFTGTAIDMAVFSKDYKTISLLPIEATKIYAQINRTIRRHTNYTDLKFEQPKVRPKYSVKPATPKVEEPTSSEQQEQQQEEK